MFFRKYISFQHIFLFSCISHCLWWDDERYSFVFISLLFSCFFLSFFKLKYSNVISRIWLLSHLGQWNTLTASLQRVRLPQWVFSTSAEAVEYTDCNEYLGYDSKQSDCEVLVMLELWGMQSTPSLSLLPGPLWPRVVAPGKGPIYGSNRSNGILMLNWIVWLNWIAWNKNVIDN